MCHCCPAEFLLVAEKRKVPPGCGMACRQLHGQVVPSYRRPPTLKCLRLCEYSYTDTHRSTDVNTYLPNLTKLSVYSICTHIKIRLYTCAYSCFGQATICTRLLSAAAFTELSGSFLHEGCQAAARAAGRAPSTCEVLLAL